MSFSFFLIYLLLLILSIISSFFIVFKISSVFTALLLTGVHLIFPNVTQSSYKIPLHLSQIFLMVYLKVPSLTNFFTLFIQPIWLCHLWELNQIPLLCWWHPIIHFFHSFKFNFFIWNTFWYFPLGTLLDDLKRITPQSIQHWIFISWHKSMKTEIPQLKTLSLNWQWYHPLAWLHLLAPTISRFVQFCP